MWRLKLTITSFYLKKKLTNGQVEKLMEVSQT